MKTQKLKLNLNAEPQDYFYVEADGKDSFTITLTDASRSPLHISNVNRRQLYQLLTQANRAVLAIDTKDVDSLFTEETTTDANSPTTLQDQRTSAI